MLRRRFVEIAGNLWKEYGERLGDDDISVIRNSTVIHRKPADMTSYRERDRHLRA